MRQAGLSPREIRWAQAQITRYNSKIANGTVTPVHIAGSTKPVSVSRTATDMVATTSSTGGLSYGWYIAHAPYEYTTNYWWGQSYIYNELATQHIEAFYGLIAAGASMTAAGSTDLDWSVGGIGITGLLAAAAGASGAMAADMAIADNGYGDHFNEAWNGLPLGWYANVP